MFKLFKNEKTEMEGVDMKNTYALIEDEQIPMEELVENYKNMKQAEKDNEKSMMNEEDEIEIEGSPVKVKDLIEAYNMMKENADDDSNDDDEKKNEGDDKKDDEKDNESDKKDDDKKNEGDEKEKKNSFKKLKTAFNNSGSKASKPNLNLKSERLNRGSSRYGSVQKIQNKEG